jgi:thiol-disulfide isomerase/thioredoxin
MKKSQFFGFVLIVFSSALLWAKPQVIKGTMKGIEVYSYVYLYELFGPESNKIDSSKHVAGAFVFNLKNTLPRGMYRVGVNEKLFFDFVNDQSNLVLTCDASAAEKIKVANSVENSLYKEYLKYNATFNEEFNKLNQEAQNNAGLRNTDPEKYNQLINRLQTTLDSLNKNLKTGLKGISNKNKGTFMAKVAEMFSYSDTVSAANFFSKAELTDPEYTKGDMLTSKVYMCMQRFYANVDLPVGVANLTSRFEKPNANKEVFYLSLIRGIYNQNAEYARTLAEQCGREFPNSKFAAYYLTVIPKSPPKVGEEVPEIKLKDFMGKEVSLSSLKGKVVLLDFWASWCGPCRKENPNVVRAYQKYKDKGFTVFSVSLDDNRDRWIAAIQQDQLIWENHVSDLKGWNSSAAKLYGVKSIPSTFLLDKNGKIVATNLRGMELEIKLEQLLAQ